MTAAQSSTTQPPRRPIDLALIYATRFGLAVFPLAPRSKVPQIKGSRGVLDASKDPEQIGRWWSQYPEAGVAIACGETSGVFVLDVDPRNGGDESLAALEREHGALPDTPRCLTGGGGAHYYFKLPAGLELKGRVGEGLDIKSRGGYVVAPPSVHPSGLLYRWDMGALISETAIADAPMWLLEAASDRGSGVVRGAVAGSNAADTLIGEAFRLAGWLGAALPGGKHMARCPWVQEHSDGRGDGRDSSTVLMPPTTDARFGGFVCSHSHCQGRTWQDVLSALPEAAVAAARKKYRPLQAVEGGRPAAPTTAPEAAPDWQADFIRKKDGGLASFTANLLLILTNDGRWANKLRFNEFTSCVDADTPPWDEAIQGSEVVPHWTDRDDQRLALWSQRTYGLKLSAKDCGEIVDVVAARQAYHPVRRYLDSVTWDGGQRLRHWLSAFAGADNTEYTQRVATWWMLSAVARVMRPGEKADCMLILEGPQGLKKSSLLAALVPNREWFSDTGLDVTNKDAFASLNGKWIIEWPELDGLSRADHRRVKAFMSSAVDYYRPSYGRRFVSAKRQCVFAGTTNETQYLSDPTGARRYWPIRCSRIDLEGAAQARDLLWAEAMHLYRSGALWWPETEGDKLLTREAQEARQAESDAWEPHLARYLNGHPEVTVDDLLANALGVQKDRITHHDSIRVGRILAHLGCKKVRRNTEGARSWVWVRCEPWVTR